MNLDTFEKRIDSTILSRGRSSYRENSVLSLEMTSSNHYKAKVRGTRLYEVTVTLDDDREGEDSSCTCPYDWGEHCKHQVAVMYALRHLLDNNKHTMVERPEEVDLAALLEGKSKKELLSFLLPYAKKDPSLASALVAAFPSPNQEVNQTNLGIEFRKACDKGIERTPYEDDMYGWDEYDADEEDEDWQFSSALNKKIEALLGMARSAIQAGDIRHGGSIASMMVHELCSLDYDSEYLLVEIEEVIAQVEALFDDSTIKADDATWLFELFFPEVRDYNDVPQEALLSLCFQVAETEDDQEVLRNYLVDLASEETPVEGHVNHTILTCLELQHCLLIKQHRVDDAKAFALANLAYEGMRLIAFQSALDAKDYALAEKLAKEKEASAYRAYGSIDWSILLFKVYQESGDKAQVRSLAKEFLLHDKLAYYPILKGTYEQKEWEASVDGLLDELQARDGGSMHGNRTKAYLEVLKAEGKLERLLAYIQKQPYLVQSYQEVLLPHYKDEVFALYSKVILSKGETVANRN
jgi:hypothetical protein